jgi:DNA-binding Lrp family transcriptional regulator
MLDERDLVILRILSQKDKGESFLRLLKEAGMSKPSLIARLQKLRKNARLIERQPEENYKLGKKVFYRLNPKAHELMVNYINPLYLFFNNHLEVYKELKKELGVLDARGHLEEKKEAFYTSIKLIVFSYLRTLLKVIDFPEAIGLVLQQTKDMIEELRREVIELREHPQVLRDLIDRAEREFPGIKEAEKYGVHIYELFGVPGEFRAQNQGQQA